LEKNGKTYKGATNCTPTRYFWITGPHHHKSKMIAPMAGACVTPTLGGLFAARPVRIPIPTDLLLISDAMCVSLAFWAVSAGGPHC